MKKLGPVAAKKNQDKSCLENQDKDKSVVVTLWFKNKRVLLIYYFVGEQPLGKCERCDHKLKEAIEILQAKFVNIYNETWVELTSLT